MSERVLKLFLQHNDKFISGEELARQLDMSRTAVWKHIRTLRQQGYEFEAIPRVGYRLVARPARLETVALMAHMQTDIFGQHIHLLEQTDSTQTVARRLIADGDTPEGTLVIAEQQTAGRGRHGRPWHSPAGKGIWMSLVTYPKIPPQYCSQLTLLAAVAVTRAIKKRHSIDVGIKWPNDLLINGKKICGILLESSIEGESVRYVIVGIGISANIRQEDYPEDLRDKATSILNESGHEVDRQLLICDTMHQFEQLYTIYQEQGFSPIKLLWESLSVSLDQTVRVQTHEGVIEGVAESVDDYGALVVRTPDGLVRVYSGEVTMG